MTGHKSLLILICRKYSKKKQETVFKNIFVFRFLKGAKTGDNVTVEAKTLKTGKSLGFLEIEIKNENGELLVKASHTKFVGI